MPLSMCPSPDMALVLRMWLTVPPIASSSCGHSNCLLQSFRKSFWQQYSVCWGKEGGIKMFSACLSSLFWLASLRLHGTLWENLSWFLMLSEIPCKISLNSCSYWRLILELLSVLIANILSRRILIWTFSYLALHWASCQCNCRHYIVFPPNIQDMSYSITDTTTHSVGPALWMHFIVFKFTAAIWIFHIYNLLVLI